ncbi:MAG: rhodanese-like domain-containing protein [Acidobacteriaceae bacterium]|nr:rhodanese-like domain-containing protein [Acidobacteriaceae bacterium]
MILNATLPGGFLDANLVKNVFGWARKQSHKPSERVPRLSGLDLDLLQSPRALLLDLRAPFLFSAAFIPGSVNLPEFESPDLLHAAGLIGERSVYLLSDADLPVERAVRFFERFDRMPVAGRFAEQAIETWRKTQPNTGKIEYISAETLGVRLAAWKTVVADIRDPAAFRKAHIPDAISIPLNNLAAALDGLPRQTSLSLVCDEGKSCTFAASLLWSAGYRQLAVVRGGFAAYLEHGFPLQRW